MTVNPITHLTIFQTSDEHGHIENAGRIAKIIDDAKTENPDGVMYVSSGDFFTDSSTFVLQGTRPSIDVANASDLRVMAVGDHDCGKAFFPQWMPGFKPTIVSANMVDGTTGQPLPGIKPFEVATLKGIKLGFVGLTTPNTANIITPKQLGDIKFTDPTAAAQKAVESLHEQGVGVIFALSHLEDAENQAVADKVPGGHSPGLQILGGHTHQTWQQPKLIDGDDVSHPGPYRQSMTRVDVDVDTVTGQPVSVKYTLVPIDPKGPEDDVVGPIVHHYEGEMQKVLDTPIGILPRPLRHDDALPDDIDPIITHVMLESTHADMAFLNKKYVREGLPGGSTTQGNLMDSMPFENTLVTGQVAVSDLNKMLVESTRRHDQTSLTIRFGNNNLSFQNGAIVDGSTSKPLDPEKSITVATIDYLLGGGLDYLPQNKYTVPADAPKLRDVFGTYLGQEAARW